MIVNDFGGRLDGSSTSKLNPAAKVVQEIENNGGKAVADYNDVLDGSVIVGEAIKRFGKVDILVNNTGILRDKSFIKMTLDDWRKVIDVHLDGTFKLHLFF